MGRGGHGWAEGTMARHSGLSWERFARENADGANSREETEASFVRENADGANSSTEAEALTLRCLVFVWGDGVQVMQTTEGVGRCTLLDESAEEWGLLFFFNEEPCFLRGDTLKTRCCQSSCDVSVQDMRVCNVGTQTCPWRHTTDDRPCMEDVEHGHGRGWACVGAHTHVHVPHTQPMFRHAAVHQACAMCCSSDTDVVACARARTPMSAVQHTAHAQAPGSKTPRQGSNLQLESRAGGAHGWNHFLGNKFLEGGCAQRRSLVRPKTKPCKAVNLELAWLFAHALGLAVALVLDFTALCVLPGLQTVSDMVVKRPIPQCCCCSNAATNTETQ